MTFPLLFIFKLKKKLRAWGYSSVVKHMPSMGEALATKTITNKTLALFTKII
jgi:hypothetical protein